MSIVQDGAFPCSFFFILADHSSFDNSATGNSSGQQFRFQLYQLANIVFQELKEFLVQNQTVLDNFSPARGQFTLRQSDKSLRVSQNQVRLIEGTNKVLPFRMVNPDLAPDTGINHRYQAGRHLYPGHTSQESGSRKTC